MTDSIRVLRGRRTSSLDAVPPELAAWFAGTGPESWYSLLPYERELLPSRWRAWKATHPNVNAPPRGYEWIADPTDPQYPSEADVREARKMLMRSQPR